LRVSLFVFLAFVVCITARAATITSSVTCYPSSGAPISGSLSCSSGTGVTAHVSATYAIPEDPSSFLTAQISGEALEYQPGEGYAAGTISLHLQLYTLGPPRTGVADLLIATDQGPTIQAGSGRVSGTAGPYSIPSCPTGGSTCHIVNSSLPFQLGTPFNVDLNASLMTNSNPASFGGHSFTVEVRLALREFNNPPFQGPFEVQIYEVPEPAHLLASGVGFLGILLFRRIERSRPTARRPDI
jgi:hypothetical protein